MMGVPLADRINQHVFNAFYASSLIYNACRVFPAVDRQALEIGSDDTMLVITNAGCNVLDYALSAPEVLQISPFVPGLCTSCFVYIGRKLATRETTA